MIQYIAFEEIPMELDWPKFKEHFYDRSTNKFIECLGDSYFRVNIKKLESIIFYEEENLVGINGMTGKFFI